MSASRYAIYFVPAKDSALYRLGCSVLGYDCYSGHDVAFPSDLPTSEADWRSLTEAPHTYGFHATLKAPFSLAAGFRATDIQAALHVHAISLSKPVEFLPTIRLLDDFIAIVPVQPVEALHHLASQCTIALDRFRAPLTVEDRARRLKAPLTARQTENLDRWGYPYVFEDFRFHMTLTGSVAASEGKAALAYLQKLFAGEFGGEPIRIDRLALLEQENPGARFRVISQAIVGAN